jgi:hypothetical protein
VDKQFYYLDVFKWLFGEPMESRLRAICGIMIGSTSPAGIRVHARQMGIPVRCMGPRIPCSDLIHIDPDFAKQQLLVVLRNIICTPTDRLTYEWNLAM